MRVTRGGALQLIPQISQLVSLIDIQARMALRADASRMFLGYFWWALEPLLYVAVFYLVFGVILDSRREDFLLFLVCGKLPFMWFSGSVNTASNSMLAARGLIGQTNLPKVLFPLAKVQEGLYRQAAVFALLFCIVYSNGIEPTFTWFWLFPLMLVQYLVIVPCAILGSVLVCVAQDFMRVIALATIFLMFVSGIFWDVRSIPSLEMQQLIFAVNPIAFLLDSYRQVLMFNTLPDAGHLLWLGLAGVAATCGAVALVSRLEHWIAMRVLSL